MAKHIGIVACSAEGAALCYRTICAEASARMGTHMHPEVTLHTFPLGRYMPLIRNGNWAEVGRLMTASARIVAAAGADFAVCPDNTIHQSFDLAVADSPIPWLHIADVVGEEAQRQGYRRLAVTGTKYLMTGPVYPRALARVGIACEIPDAAARERINAIIFDELVNGIVRETSRLYLNGVIQALRAKGCDAAVLGCTEIPLLIDPADCPLPTLDSTRLLARAALKNALAETQRTQDEENRPCPEAHVPE